MRVRLNAGVTVLVVLFLAFDGITKVIRLTPVVEARQKTGIASDLVTGIGPLLLACTAIYVVPRTAILGAILLTGYLGGAVTVHVIARSGIFPGCICNRLRRAGLGRTDLARTPIDLLDFPAAVTRKRRLKERTERNRGGRPRQCVRDRVFD